MDSSEASDPSALPDADDAGEAGEHTLRPPGRGPDRRQRHRWVPVTAGWLSLLTAVEHETASLLGPVLAGVTVEWI